MKIAIYSRKSKFTTKGESINNQIELCKEYAIQHFNVTKFIVYEDEGFSGGNTHRPEYKKMLNDAQNCNFDILMCYRLDRISRNISDFSDTIETLQSNNIAFVSIREQFDTSTPMGRAMMYIASVFAQLERETIAERIRDNMLQLSRSGRWLGGKTPTGYISEAIEYYDADMNRKTMYKLTQKPEELELVKLIFNKYIEFKSLNQVEVWSTTNNIKTPNGSYFNINTTRNILTNMVYVKADSKIHNYCKSHNMDIASDISEFNGSNGLMVYNKNIIRKGKANKLREPSEWIVAVGKHKGIIDSSDFLKVQKMLKRNKNKAPREGTSKVGLLNTLLICKNCGSRFKLVYGNKRNDGTRPYYYKCRLKEVSKGTKCNIDNLSGELIDELVLEEIKQFIVSSSKFYKALITQKRNVLKLNDSHRTDVNSLRKQLLEYHRIAKNLTLQLGQVGNSVANKHIIRQIEEIDQKINTINNKINILIDSKKEITLKEQESIKLLKNTFSNFNDLISKLEHFEKKKLVCSIIDKVIWDGKNLEITTTSSE
ncbi:recombinase family protein [Brassicibacter mesophilus]|uniref:recombinase family protein n=1 Tax=Brassicibacter mesophilus TaxID=745119 RepID=UPI003D1C4E6E